MGVKVPRTRSGGTWTEAQYRNFIRGTLRRASQRWRPIGDVLRKARVAKGMYRCANGGHIVPLTKNKQKNVFVDHIIPVVDPKKGFTTWDDFIHRLFCEEEGLQVLCRECHDIKTKDERELLSFNRKLQNNE